MKDSTKIEVCRRALVTGLAVSALSLPLLANGNETLGNPADGGPPGPALAIADGTQVIMNGIGLAQAQPGMFTIDIPAGVTVQQVIAYWEGMSQTPDQQGATDTIQVNGGDLVGDRIGGPNFFFSFAYSMTYRASLPTDFVTVGGSTMVTVGGLDFDRSNDGFGLLVIVDDGINATEVGVRDGNDTAFINFPSPRDTTVPQVFTFAPVGYDRTATFSHFFASVEPNRPSIITIDIPGFPTQTLDNAIGDSNGPEWDTLVHDVVIPANASQVTLQPLSADCCASGVLPASFVWLGCGFFFPEPCSGKIGDLVWLDESRDGCQDVDEPGVEGVILNLSRKNPDGSIDFLDTTVTDENGIYCFGGLCAGDYLIEIESVPDGLTETEPNACAGDDTRDSDCVDGMVCVTLPTDFFQDITVDCGLLPPPDGGGEGCTPGFWKNRGLRIDAWEYSPDANFDAVFGTSVFGTSTLLEVIRNRPDVDVPNLYLALGRHAVAALLNAASPDVDYDLDEAGVIALVAGAYATGDLGIIEDVKDSLDAYNNQGSPICD